MRTSDTTYNTGIYIILNKISKHFYPGSAVNLNDRWEIHKSLLNHNKHFCNHLQNAWNKYGPDAFTFLHIEYTTLDALTPVWSEKHQCKVIVPEQFWLDKYWGTGLLYNTCPIAGSTKGLKRTPDTEETRKKKSESAKNKPPDTEETRKRKREAALNKPPVTEETKRKQREAARPPISEESRKKHAETISLTWQITYPNGTIKNIKNLKQFCRDNNLNSIMNQVAKEKENTIRDSSVLNYHHKTIFPLFSWGYKRIHIYFHFLLDKYKNPCYNSKCIYARVLE
jgi:group I intron endonuclease